MTLDVLAIGAHPDDVELACGGTVALLAGRGRRVGILHLTRGESGTRGTPEEREEEARAAAEVLGAERVDFLDCGDGALRHGRVEEDRLVALLRELRPEIVLGPPEIDRHPDHGRAHRLVADACFYAGLAARAPQRGEPHRPGAVFSYMQHHHFEPDFLVDVSDAWQKKVDALACYRSQLHRVDREEAEVEARDEEPEARTPEARTPETKVSSPEFARSVEGRARHFGILLGVEMAEPFASPLPLSIRDPMVLVPESRLR